MKKRLWLGFLVFAMVLAFIPGMSNEVSAAEPVKYTECTWDGEKIIENENECVDYIVVDEGTARLEKNQWYVVDAKVLINDVITVTGEANLIIKDDCTLNATKGIVVNEGDSLNIFGQNAGSGLLTASGSAQNAGIGGDYLHNGGNVNIYGASVNASGYIGSGGYGGAAGIGGGNLGGGGNIAVYGGTVTASGGGSAAGIGGGNQGNGGKITIYGGTITANGGDKGAGVGGGWKHDGGNFTIFGGELSATGGQNSAAIGGGYEGDGGIVTIRGGSVTAISGGQGRAIGAGFSGSSDGTVDVAKKMQIKGGENADSSETISEVGSEKYLSVSENTSLYQIKYINRYLDKDSGRVVEEEQSLMPGDYTLVTGDTTELEEGWYVVTGDITNSKRLWIYGDVKLILCDGAKLEAVNSIIVKSMPAEDSAENSLTIYGQANDSGELIVSCSDYSREAAIGSMGGENSGNITINGGTVTAESLYGAGIGGGNKGNGSVTINGGTVTAMSSFGAGIGGGNEGNGSVTINGGSITAKSTYGAGVGNGDGGSGSTITLGKGVAFGAGTDKDNITEWKSIDNVQKYKYFQSPYVVPHTHSWSSDWTYDDAGHWHACTAANCSITDYSSCGESGAAYAEHSYKNYICVCGAVDLTGAKEDALGAVAAAKRAAVSDEAKAVSTEDIDAATNLDDVAAAKTAALEAIEKAEKELADAQAAAKKAIEDIVSVDASDGMKAIVREAIEKIMQTGNAGNLEQLIKEYRVKLDVQEDKEAMRGVLESDEYSDEMKELAQDALDELDTVRTSQELTGLWDKYNPRMRLQLAKDAARKDVKELLPDNASDEVKKIVSDACDVIQTGNDPNEFEGVIEATRQTIEAQIQKEKELAKAKADAISEINDAKTDASAAVAEKAVEDINTATSVEAVNSVREQALADMAKADVDPDTEADPDTDAEPDDEVDTDDTVDAFEAKEDANSKPADQSNPQTGENSIIHLWILVFAGSVAALSAAAMQRRKRKHN